MWHLEYAPKTIKQFVGQTQPLNQLREWLARRKKHQKNTPIFACVHGPCGTGKTIAVRLAIETQGFIPFSLSFEDGGSDDFRALVTKFGMHEEEARPLALVIDNADFLPESSHLMWTEIQTKFLYYHKRWKSERDLSAKERAEREEQRQKKRKKRKLEPLSEFYSKFAYETCNPVIFIVNQPYKHEVFKQIKRDGLSVAFQAHTSENLKTIVRRAMNQAKLPHHLFTELWVRRAHGDARRALIHAQTDCLLLSKNPIKTCAQCARALVMSNSITFPSCVGCHRIFYCSVPCQLQHAPEHRLNCTDESKHEWDIFQTLNCLLSPTKAQLNSDELETLYFHHSSLLPVSLYENFVRHRDVSMDSLSAWEDAVTDYDLYPDLCYMELMHALRAYHSRTPGTSLVFPPLLFACQDQARQFKQQLRVPVHSSKPTLAHKTADERLDILSHLPRYPQLAKRQRPGAEERLDILMPYAYYRDKK